MTAVEAGIVGVDVEAFDVVVNFVVLFVFVKVGKSGAADVFHVFSIDAVSEFDAIAGKVDGFDTGSNFY